MPSHNGTPHNLSPLAILLFRSAEDISEGSSCHPRSAQPISRLLSHSSHVTQPVQSLSLNHFNGVSVEWALTHRSFPGSYLTLLIFPEVFANSFQSLTLEWFIISQMSFPGSFSNSFHSWLNPFAFDSPGVSKLFMVAFLVVILIIGRSKKIFLSILLFSLQDSWF